MAVPPPNMEEMIKNLDKLPPHVQFGIVMKELSETFRPLSINQNRGGLPLAKFRGHALPAFMPLYWPQLRNFPITEEDFVLFSMPKCGKLS